MDIDRRDFLKGSFSLAALALVINNLPDVDDGINEVDIKLDEGIICVHTIGGEHRYFKIVSEPWVDAFDVDRLRPVLERVS